MGIPERILLIALKRHDSQYENGIGERPDIVENSLPERK